MKNVVHPAVWLLLVLAPILAYNRVDFTGEWSFDKAASTFTKGGDRFAPVRFKVEQQESQMTVQHIYQREYEHDFVDTLTFSLDGKKNYSEFWTSPRVITAEWSDDQNQLTINTKIDFAQERQDRNMLSTDVWRLVDDRTLLRDLTLDGPLGELKVQYLFNRIE